MKIFLIFLFLGSGIGGYLYFSHNTMQKNPHQSSYINTSSFSYPNLTEQVSKQKLEVATLAGGCFWCMEAPYEKIEGIEGVVSGYAGGTKEKAVYKKVGSGQTQHRESIQVFFNPQKISYSQIIDIFWHQINPTDTSGQFADRGHQYTSAIFYHSEKQKKSAENAKNALEQSGKFSESIAVPILPFSTFFPAETYHQDYYKKNPTHYNQYKKGSGRVDYIHEKWEKELIQDKKLEKKHDTNMKFMKEKNNLTPLQFEVTQKNGTEAPFDNKYWNNTEEGIYTDIVSGEVLFSSQDKFKSGTGWPSFTKPLNKNNIIEKRDTSLFTERTEVRSKDADSHLGHIFTDGPIEKGGLRYCINSASLQFIPRSQLDEKGYAEWEKIFNQ